MMAFMPRRIPASLLLAGVQGALLSGRNQRIQFLLCLPMDFHDLLLFLLRSQR
jgi:hypothetical protein